MDTESPTPVDRNLGLDDNTTSQDSAHSTDTPLSGFGNFVRDESEIPEASQYSSEIPTADSGDVDLNDSSAPGVSAPSDGISKLVEAIEICEGAASSAKNGGDPTAGPSVGGSPIPRFKKQGVYMRRKKLRTLNETHNFISGVVMSELDLTAASMRGALPVRMPSEKPPPKKMSPLRLLSSLLAFTASMHQVFLNHFLTYIIAKIWIESHLVLLLVNIGQK